MRFSTFSYFPHQTRALTKTSFEPVSDARTPSLIIVCFFCLAQGWSRSTSKLPPATEKPTLAFFFLVLHWFETDSKSMRLPNPRQITHEVVFASDFGTEPHQTRAKAEFCERKRGVTNLKKKIKLFVRCHWPMGQGFIQGLSFN